MSSRDVSKIINNHQEKINPSQEKSYTSKAFKMYLEGKSPINIVIELDISPSEAEKTYLDYLRLSNRYEVTLLYIIWGIQWPGVPCKLFQNNM